jgi:hypothetical protein
MPDIDKLLIKLYKVKTQSKNRVGLNDCYKLYLIVKELAKLVSYLENLKLREQNYIEEEDSTNELDFLNKVFSDLYSNFEKYKVFIENSLDLDSIETKREYLLNPSKKPFAINV